MKRPPFEVPLLAVEERLFHSDLACIGRFVCPAAHPLFADSGPATSHCVAFPRRGVWIRHRDEEAFVADSTVVTLYNQGDEYQRRRIDDRGDHCEWFAVAPDVLLELAASHDPGACDDERRPFRVRRAESDRHTYLLQRSLVEYVLHARAPDVLRVEEQAIGIVDRALGAACLARRRSSRPTRELVEATRAVLARRFAEPMTLRRLAAEVGCSPFHVCHAFKATSGTTITRHRDRLRVQAALERLADGRERLVDVALELGYSSHSHFTTSFRRAFGTTPSAFRRNLQAKRM